MSETYLAHESDDYLIHYGVLGMKWGVRRYQNPDGSLTSEGLKRYGSGQPRQNRHRRAYERISKDEADLRKHGYTKEADAVKKVADTQLAKAEKAEAKNNGKSINPDTLKKVAIAGGVVIGTALAAYGAYKISGMIKDKAYIRTINEGRNAIHSLMNDSLQGYLKTRVEDLDNGLRAARFGLAPKDSIFNSSWSGVEASTYFDRNMRSVAANNSKTLRNAISTLRGKGEKTVAERVNSVLEKYRIPIGKDGTLATSRKDKMNIVKDILGEDHDEVNLWGENEITKFLEFVSRYRD